jgi:TRAP-type C4-dicarboxylate transport system substrate-binding protein
MGRRLAGWVFAGLAAVIATAAHADPIVLRLADSLPSGHIIDRLMIEPFIKAVAEKSHGQIVIQHYPAEQLGKSRDLIMLVKAGVADIGFILPSYISDRLPLTAVAELPGIFQTTCQGSAALRTVAADGAILDREEFQPNGIKPLIVFLMPPYQMILSSHRQLNSIKDVEGLKIRTPGGAIDLTALGIGTVPIHVAPPEIYESIARGTLDGALLAYQSVTAYHLTPLIRSATIGEDFGTVAITFSIGLDKWRALPPDAQAILKEAGQALSEQACGKFDAAEDASRETLRTAGVHLMQSGDAERAMLNTSFETIRAEWAERLDRRGKPGSEVLSTFRDAVAAAKPQ